MGNVQESIKTITTFLQGEWLPEGQLQESIETLVTTIEQLQEENGAMAEKHAEKDIALNDMKVIIQDQQEIFGLYKLQETILLERLKRQTLQMKEMKENSRLTRFYDMAEENLRMAQELQRYKDMLKGGNESEQCQTSHSFS
jgi:hypothetical protein